VSAIDIPSSSEREYLRAFGITALFVAASPAGSPTLIGYTRDLGRSIESIRGRWHWSTQLTHAWWLARDGDARKIIDQVNAAFPLDEHGRFDVDAEAIATRMRREALALNIKLTEHSSALQRVQAALAQVDSVIASANAAGDLRWFNKTYKAWRVGQPPNVAAALPYGLARHRLRAAIVRRIARGDAPLSLEPLSLDLASEVFVVDEKRGLDALAVVGVVLPSAEVPKRAYGLPTANRR